MTTLRILFWIIVGMLLIASWPWAIFFACAVGLVRDHRTHRKPTTTRRRT